MPARRVAVVRAFVDGEKDVKQTTDDVAAALTNTATEIVDKVAAYWEASEEKPTIVAVGFASLLAIYFADTVVGAVDRLPLVSTTFELIGLSFTAWTAYRYFLVDGEKVRRAPRPPWVLLWAYKNSHSTAPSCTALTPAPAPRPRRRRRPR